MASEDWDMGMIDRLIEQGQASEQKEAPSDIEELRKDVESFSRQLDRLRKLEDLFERKYRKKSDDLIDQFNRANGYQNELKGLAKQLKRNKERQSTLGKQICDLERHKKIIRETMKQVARYEKSSSEQMDALKAEREVLCQRVQDLMQMLEIAEQAELSEKEWEIVCQRVCATRELLEECGMDIRKRTIDLLFEFYIAPKNNGLGR